MTTHKIILLAGIIFIFSLALPGTLLAGAVNGADWHSTELGQTTNIIEQVISPSSTVAYSEIGMDWYSGDRMILDSQEVANHPFSTEKITGIGMDWHSEKSAIPSASEGDCLALGDLGVKGENC